MRSFGMISESQRTRAARSGRVFLSPLSSAASYRGRRCRTGFPNRSLDFALLCSGVAGAPRLMLLLKLIYKTDGPLTSRMSCAGSAGKLKACWCFPIMFSLATCN
jgi:hypothetical protein